MKLIDDIQSADKALKESAHNINILLVEDDKELQQQLKIFLSKFFYSVDTADYGLDAISKYKNKHYDIVITDLLMPYMSGLSLAKHIKAINAKQPIIVISANSEGENLIELINIGIDSFLCKPIDMNLVIKQLDKTCQKINEDKMTLHFSNMLEETNKELQKRNTEPELTLIPLR